MDPDLLMQQAVEPPLSGDDAATMEQMVMEGDPLDDTMDPMDPMADPTDGANPLFPSGAEWESGLMPPPEPPPPPFLPETNAPIFGEDMGALTSGADQGTGMDPEGQVQALIDQHAGIQDMSDQYQGKIMEKNSKNPGFSNI